nr:frizzled [Hymenolepis microstoma]
MNGMHLSCILLLTATSIAGESEPFHGLKKPNYHDDDDQAKCTPIREPICQNLEYKDTIMPNLVKMTSQEEAAKRMIDYKSLLNVNCSHFLKLFLCTIYFPMCDPVLQSSAIKPCKSLCIHVRNRCEPIMQQFNFSWPTELNCDDLPKPPDLCIEPPNGYGLDDQKPFLPTASSNIASLQRMYPHFQDLFLERGHGSPNIDSFIQAAVADGSVPMVPRTSSQTCTGAEFSAGQTSNDTCLTYCGADLYYRPAGKKFARAWLLSWSVLCVFSSALTFLSFFADGSRLQYPERPVLYLAACYFVMGLGYISQYFLGPERVICRSIQITDSGSGGITRKYLLIGGQESTLCTVGFLISYYFGMASNFWWVMLSLAWYLSTSRKWGHEGVESVSSVFHMFAWALPAIQAILILILHKIDADELTGTCYTGFHNESALMYGVLLPQAICLVLGLLLLSVGFAAVLRVRRKLKTPTDRERDSRRRLEKSIAKLGVFVVLYTFPMGCLLASNLYEYLGQSKWRVALKELNTLRPHCLSQRGVAWGFPDCHPKESPSTEAAMLRIFMTFVVGITSGMWVWANKKTLVSWKRAIYHGKRRHLSPAVPQASQRQLSLPQIQQQRSKLHRNGTCYGGPFSADGAESERPDRGFANDATTILSAPAVRYSSSAACQSCHLCPPPPPAPTDLTGGGYSSASGQSLGLEMYGECFMHQHMSSPSRDQCFHPTDFGNFRTGKGNSVMPSLLHRPQQNNNECN